MYDNFDIKIYIEYGEFMKPHVVILGAGATIATIPDGDRNGNRSSVMNGLLKKLDLDILVKDIKLNTDSDNLEDIYSELHERKDCVEIVTELENRLYKYFGSLELPDNPTIYDFLVLSLTEKDVIATFNWDPLLIQAYIRCSKITGNLPHIFCLHGNTAMGYCEEHVEFGSLDAFCPVCMNRFPPTPLLYPVKEKNYSSNDYIKKSWEAVEQVIEGSYMLTIFGYSAPSSDEAAISLLKRAWGSIENRRLEQVSIIDIESETSLVKKWDKFIYSHHYLIENNFFDSYLGMFPRRSCEQVFATYSLNMPTDGRNGFKEGMSWEDIKEFLDQLLLDELNTEQGKNYPPYHPYFDKSVI